MDLIPALPLCRHDTEIRLVDSESGEGRRVHDVFVAEGREDGCVEFDYLCEFCGGDAEAEVV